jgi:L-fuculose-phosphate aldolase
MAHKLTVVRHLGQEPVENKLRREICTVGRWMYRRGYVVAREGNLSVRLSGDRVLVTPAGTCKGLLAPEELLVTDLNGQVISGSGRPSSEMKMHLLIYRTRPDVGAVCHAHPPTATGFASAGRSLEEAVLPEVVSDLGAIPLAPYGTPGTEELCVGLEPLVPNHDAILLENHGVVTCGQDLTTAYHRMETVEHFAQVLWTAETIGKPRLLARAEVEKLIAARPRHGISCAAGAADVPLSAETSRERIVLTRKELESLVVAAVQKDRAIRSREKLSPQPRPPRAAGSATDSR